jgi:hypothetical protein
MATGTIQLLIEGSGLPDGTTSNAFPAISIERSSASSNPKFVRYVAAFDDTTDETISFGFRLPSNWASGGSLVFHWYPVATNTSKNVRWRAAIQAVTPGDSTVMTSLDPISAGSGWVAVTTACPGTIGYPATSSISLTMTGAAAGDRIALLFQRYQGDTIDDTVGDVIIADGLDLEYTTT